MRGAAWKILDNRIDITFDFIAIGCIIDVIDNVKLDLFDVSRPLVASGFLISKDENLFAFGISRLGRFC